MNKQNGKDNTVNVVNPDHKVLQQMEGQWQKLLCYVLYKLHGTKPLRLTEADLIAMKEAFPEPDMPTIMVRGDFDSTVIGVISYIEAQKMAEAEKGKKS